MSIDQRIREGLRTTNDQLPAPHIDRALAAVTAGGRPTHRRNLGVGLAAVAAAVLVIAGVLAVTRGENDAPQPIGPSTPTEKTAPADTTVNGRIGGAEQDFAPHQAPCDGCALPGWWIGYDVDTERALWTYYDLTDPSGWTPLAGLAVVGPDRELVDLSCADDLVCRADGAPWSSAAALGPGVDELTLGSGARTVQVIGYDGTVRRTFDLSAGLVRGERVEAVAWSPDRSRLAVQASVFPHSNDIRTLVFDRDGGGSTLVHTTARRNAVPHVLKLAWSPDGTRLGFVESFEFSTGPTDLVSVRVPDVGQQEPGAATTLYSWELGWSGNLDGLDAEEWFAWSPDGTRVAVGAADGLLELSSDDGSVLAQHSIIRGPLVWPARQP